MSKRFKASCIKLQSVIKAWLKSCFGRKYVQPKPLQPRNRNAVFFGSVRDSAYEDLVIERKRLIEQLLPSSRCHLVGRLYKPRELPNGESYNYIVTSRYVIFREDDVVEEMLSFFFAVGFKEGEGCKYQVQALLDDAGAVKWVREMRFEKVGPALVAKPTKILQEDESIAQMTRLIDSFLQNLEGAASFETLPPRHWLLRPMALEFRDVSRLR